MHKKTRVERNGESDGAVENRNKERAAKNISTIGARLGERFKNVRGLNRLAQRICAAMHRDAASAHNLARNAPLHYFAGG